MANQNESPQLLVNFLFPKVFQSFRMAVQPSKLFIAFLAVAALYVAGSIMDLSKPVVVTRDKEGKIRETELQVYMSDPDQLPSWLEGNKARADRTGLFSTLWYYASAKFHAALRSLLAFDLPSAAANVCDYLRAVGWAMNYHYVYCIIFGLIKLVLIAIAGGAICRIAALQLARDERPGVMEGLRYSMKRFTTLVTTPLTPIAIIIFIGLFIFLLGLFGKIPYAGELIMAIFMFLALIGGTLIAILAIGAVAGFNLMFPAVAYDGSDCFDAISRSFSYIYSKPWHMGFYTAVAAVYGVICYLFVRFFTFLLLWSTYLFLRLGVGIVGLADPGKCTAIWSYEPSFGDLVGPLNLAGLSSTESLAAFVVYVLLLAVVGLVVAFILSFYFSANTIIYSLLRSKVDHTALKDIYTEEVTAEPITIEPETQETQPESQPEEQSDEQAQ